MCRVLNINESGYYRWCRNSIIPSNRELLLVEIKKIVGECPENENYGIERIRTALEQDGKRYSRRTIYRAMKEGGLLHKKRIPHGITKATDEVQEKENIIKRDFSSSAPVKKVLSDITEVQCSDGKLYVSPIFDCYNGEILALEMRSNMKKELCIDTVKQLRQRFGTLDGVIMHTDRGSQYTSEAFRDTLKSYGMIQSLSSTGKCFDNSRMESFFATLKKEKLYQIPTYRMTRDQVKTVIYRYIFGYYNTRRITGFNPGGWPPVVYRNLAFMNAA